MVRYFSKSNGSLVELQVAQPQCWIHISPPYSHAELEEIANEFDLPLDYLTDSLDIDERPRYDRWDEHHRLIVLATPILNKNDRENDSMYVTVPVGIILSLDHIVTISSFESPVLDHFIQGRVKNVDPADEKQFVLKIFEYNVDRFLSCLKKLNLKRNVIEQEMETSTKNYELRQLLGIEKSLVYFVNSLSANELLMLKMKRSDVLSIRGDEDKSDLFEDIIIDTRQALEVANIYTTILNGTMDAYGAIIANNQNMVVQRLTLVTVLISVPTWVASIFGMNVPNGLEHSRYAILYIIIISILISLLLAWFFRRKQLF
jgi:magnesium transporter